MINKFLINLLRTTMETADNKRLAKQNYPTDDIEIRKDIPYLNDGDQGHLLDIYYPKGTKGKLPTIINIHGGGLIYAYKDLNRNFNFELVRRGFAVISLSYRLIPHVTFFDQVQDILNAFAFIHDQLEPTPCDLEQLVIAGDSAGALLSMMGVAVNDNPRLQSLFGVRGSGLQFRAIGSISIMLHTKRRKDIISVVSPRIETKQQRQWEVFPYLDNPSRVLEEVAFPPFFLVTSAEDFIRQDTLDLRAILDQRRIPYEILDWPKGDSYKLEHVFSVLHPKREESIQTINGLCNLINHKIQGGMIPKKGEGLSVGPNS